MKKLYTIKRATVLEVQQLNELFLEFLNYERINYDNNIKSDLKITSFYQKRLNDSTNLILVALDNDRVIGYIHGLIDSDNKIKDKIESKIEYLYIKEKYRNKKIGTKLLNEYINYVKSKNVKYIYIENKYSNDIAKKMYSKLGFNIFIEERRKEI